MQSKINNDGTEINAYTKIQRILGRLHFTADVH